MPADPFAQAAPKAVEQLINHVFRHYGLQEENLSDRVLQFTSHVWREM